MDHPLINRDLIYDISSNIKIYPTHTISDESFFLAKPLFFLITFFFLGKIFFQIIIDK